MTTQWRDIDQEHEDAESIGWVPLGLLVADTGIQHAQVSKENVHVVDGREVQYLGGAGLLVFLDGKVAAGCVEANRKEGWIRSYNQPYVRESEPTKKTGVVEILITKPK